MVKKLFRKQGIFMMNTKDLSEEQCYFIIDNFKKELSLNDYLQMYYESKGFQY